MESLQSKERQVYYYNTALTIMEYRISSIDVFGKIPRVILQTMFWSLARRKDTYIPMRSR